MMYYIKSKINLKVIIEYREKGPGVIGEMTVRNMIYCFL